MNIAVVTSLPSTPSNGDTVLLVVGSNPVDQILLIYDSTYGKWVSHQPSLCTPVREQSFATTTSAFIPGSVMQIPNYKAYYNAGLRPQTRIGGRYRNNNSSGQTQVRAVLLTGNPHASGETRRGETNGSTYPTGTNAILTFASHWEEFDDADPDTDTQAIIRLEIVRLIAGTADILGRNWWLRWVAAP